MAVRAVRTPWYSGPAARVRNSEIKFALEGKVRTAIKLDPVEWSETHRYALATMYLSDDRKLMFGLAGWQSCWIGAGEEKAVFLVIDPQNRAFAVEVLAKGTYLAGHLAEGHYFTDMMVEGLCNKRWDSRSLYGHIFSGQIKAREFIYGDTLAGPGICSEPLVKTALIGRLLYRVGRAWANSMTYSRFCKIQRTFRDAHEANVMLELLPLSNPEKKSHYVLPILWLEEDGRLRPKFYRLTPIDVRAR